MMDVLSIVLQDYDLTGMRDVLSIVNTGLIVNEHQVSNDSSKISQNFERASFV